MLTLYYALFYYRNRTAIRLCGFKMRWSPIRLERSTDDLMVCYKASRLLFKYLSSPYRRRGFFRFIQLDVLEPRFENGSSVLLIM